MSRLPTDWKTRVGQMKGTMTMKAIAAVFDMSEGELWGERRSNKEFEDAIFRYMGRRKKRIFCNAKPTPMKQKQKRIRFRDENRGYRKPPDDAPLGPADQPLLDRENLSVEMRAAIMSLIAINRADLGGLTISEFRRWGAIMVLCDDVIHGLKKELRAARSESARYREALHRKTSGTPMTVHQSGGAER